MQRDMRPLVDRPHGGGERLAAILALVEAGTGRSTLHEGRVTESTAMVAGAAIGPADALEMSAGGVLVVEDRGGGP